MAKVAGKLKSGCDLGDVFNKLYENPDPHPIYNFYKYNLLRDYFQTYLKHLPSTLVKRHQQISYALRYKSVDTMVKNREAIYDRAASTIRESASYFIERAKSDKEDMVKCPKFINDFYLDFKYDEGRTSEQRNTDIVKEISAVIDSEPPLLGLLTRTLMTSITVVIAIILLIPFIKDYLPEYRKYVEYDAINILYMIIGAVTPWFYSIGNYIRNCKYIKKLKMMLLANTLLEVNRNMRKDYEDQVDYLYNDHSRNVMS